MKHKKIYLFMNLLFTTLTIANEVPNTLIIDNPNRPVSTTETFKKRERAEFDLNIKKISTFDVDGYVSSEQKLISFELDELETNDNFYLTENKNIFNEYTLGLNNLESSYELEKIYLPEKVVTFKYSTLPKELFLIKYDNLSKKFKKLYKWDHGNIKYINEQKGNLLFLFTEEYKPFEIVNFSKINRSLLTKGIVEIRNGDGIKIDPLTSSEVILKNQKGDILEKIALKNGNGAFKLDDSKKGIILQNGSSILNFGIGFRNGEVFLQVKGTTDSTKEYPLTIEVKNLDETTSFYNVNIKPAQYSLKILNDNLNLDFANPIIQPFNNENDPIKEIVSKGEILIDSKGLDIKVEFINNGLVQLSNGENLIDAKLEGNLLKDSSSTKVIEVLGKIKEEDMKNMPSGEYTGTTELIITIDS
ncbi:hypothetical protein [Cetobacterium somerae]|uniref:hypothetical protein n=1 Tax=Cetobacterium somerae TaxID=188913 RepID=UPI003892756F